MAERRDRTTIATVCTLAAFVGAFPAWPLVVAANRDEYLARPAAPPALLRETAPRAFGGRDLAAGGTWLGVAETGLVAGMLNRRSATDRSEAFVVSQPRGEPARADRLAPGLHLLTNLDLDDPTCPRIAASHRGFAAAGDAFARDGDLDALVARLQTVLAEHAIALDPRGPGSLCVHMGPYGTRSSSVLLVPAGAELVRYFHADGPPCRTRLEAVPLPF